MDARKLFFGLTGLFIILGVGAVASTYYGNKFLTKQNEKLTSLKVESSNLEQVQGSLVAAKKDIESYSPLEQIAKTVVPQEKDQATTIREIVKIANESGVSISSITFPSSSLGSKPGSGGAAAKSTAAATTQTEKVEGLANVEKLPITVTSDTTRPIPYQQFLGFLERLEQNRRTAQVDNISIQPDANNRNRLTFSLIINVYIKK